MGIFNNYDPEDFFFARNFNMTLAASGTLGKDAKVQYLRTLLSRETLHQFNLLPADVEGMNPLTVEAIILGLAAYFHL